MRLEVGWRVPDRRKWASECASSHAVSFSLDLAVGDSYLDLARVFGVRDASLHQGRRSQHCGSDRQHMALLAC